MIDDLLATFEFPVPKNSCGVRAYGAKSLTAAQRLNGGKHVMTKSVDAEVQAVESEHPNGEFMLILSKDNLDRDAENLWADEWMHPLPAKIHMDTRSPRV